MPKNLKVCVNRFLVPTLALSFILSCSGRPERHHQSFEKPTSGTGLAGSSTGSVSTVDTTTSEAATPAATSSEVASTPTTLPAAEPASPAPVEAAPVATTPSAPVPTPEPVPAPTPTPLPIPTPAPAPAPAVVIDWAYVLDKVIKPSCLRCHAAPVDSGDINLETYASAKLHAAEIMKAAIVEKIMPPPRKPLTPEAYAILKAWLDAGAPETVTP